MKKLFQAIFTLYFLLFTIYPLWVESYSQEDYFVVTAYYSPLPNQQYYLKWNYKDEIRLNWNGIRWASWKEVFSGMLAAPKNYKFWTKIHLEWLWVWVVEDRWWAIVNAGNRGYKNDRIDIWVWYGDEGLRRALYWGKRKVKWSIVSDSTKPTININNMKSPLWATQSLKKIPNIFNTGIWTKSSKKNILELQKFLQKIWLYKWEIYSVYNDEIIDIVYDFQVENNIMKSPYDYGAWYWWTKTRNLFLKKYINWEFDTTKKTTKSKQKQEEKDKYIELFDKALSWEKNIKKLQEILKKLDLYKWEITWKYDEELIWYIYKYQLEKEIITSEKTPWAWYFWPKTRKSLRKDYLQYLEDKKRKKELEEKFKQLEELSTNKAKEKIDSIWSVKYWDISKNVRELQILLSELWYFEYKDTAIFWSKTKQSIISYQLDKNIIDSQYSKWAWVYWPKTKSILETDIKAILLEEELEKEEIDKNYLVDIWIYKI